MMLQSLPFPGPLLSILTILLGLVLIVSGRRIFWLTIAAVGFLAGLVLTIFLLEIEPEWIGWVIALFAGGLAALLAIFLQRVAVTIAGFLMGGLFLVWLLQFLINLDRLEWLIYIVGGVIGAVLAASLFEVALIGLSSLAGAALIVGTTGFGADLRFIVFMVLVLVGIVIQSSRLTRKLL
jgi:hypothetical protein